MWNKNVLNIVLGSSYYLILILKKIVRHLLEQFLQEIKLICNVVRAISGVRRELWQGVTDFVEECKDE